MSDWLVIVMMSSRGVTRDEIAGAPGNSWIFRGAPTAHLLITAAATRFSSGRKTPGGSGFCSGGT